MYFVSLFGLLISNLFQMGLQASNFQSANRVVNATEYGVIEPREKARIRRRKGPINVLIKPPHVDPSLFQGAAPIVSNKRAQCPHGLEGPPGEGSRNKPSLRR